jgi:dedicator of cytokinesis protein 3
VIGAICHHPVEYSTPLTDEIRPFFLSLSLSLSVMPWRPLPRIAFAVATYPFQPSSPSDLPLELGDELYIIEQGGRDGSWYRGYLVAPPSLLAGLTSVKGQTLEARVFSGIFPKCCVEVREELGEVDLRQHALNGHADGGKHTDTDTDTGESESVGGLGQTESARGLKVLGRIDSRKSLELTTNRRHSRSKDPRLSGDESDSSPKSPGSSRTPELRPADRSKSNKPAAPVPMLKIGDETPTSVREPLVDEIASCLREWHSTNLHELLLNRQYGSLEKMSSLVSQLDLARRQLLHNVLTAQERTIIREQTTWNLVKGNKMLSGEVIVRDPAQRGRLLTGDDSAIEMTKLQSVMSLLDSGHIVHSEGLALHHLLLEIKTVTGANLDAMTLTTALCLKGDDGKLCPLSETFALDIQSSESMANMARSSRLKTLFTDLSAGDVGDLGQGPRQQLFLVVKVQESQSPRPRLRAKGKPAGNDASLSTKGPALLNSPLMDGQKGGRRSLMFGARRNRPGSKEGNDSISDGRMTPQPEERSSSAMEKVRNEAPPRTTVGGPPVVRTVGVGLLEVGTLMRQDKDMEQMLTVWSPAEVDDEDDEYRHTFDKNIVSILPSLTGRYIRSTKASQVHVHLHPFVAPDADTLVRTNPTSMHMVTQTQKIGFSEAPTKPRSDIYLTLSEAHLPREALLSHPESGVVQISGASAMQNLQVTIEVRDGSGKPIDHCIYPSSNSPGLTAWRTSVKEVGARWDQTICLKIPKEHVPGSHLIMSVRDAPEFPFALSWMPLWDQQAFLKDGPHHLLMHAYDKTTSSIVNGKGAYLSLPWDSAGKAIGLKDDSGTGSMATLVLDSYLCSTEYSQDQVILGLINWKQQKSAQLMDSLKKIVFVPEIEIVKQLSDVFDALFAIVVHKSGNPEYEDIVFNDLVTVLGIVHDRRFNLGPLVDQYARNRFDFPSATSCLIRSYGRLLENATDPEQARNLRAAFKVGQHILKFIIIAREQQKLKEHGGGNIGIQKSFTEDMQSIFRALENLMRNPAPVLIGSKTLVVQHFHTWLPELLAAFPKDEVFKIAVRFVNSCQDVKGRLILYKIVLILNLTQHDELFLPPFDRQALITNIFSWLAPYWGPTSQLSVQWKDQVRLCGSVVAELLRQPTSDLYHFMPKIVASYCAIGALGTAEKSSLSFLFSMTYPFASRQITGRQVFDEALLELAALMSSIARLPPPASIKLPDQEVSSYILSTLDAQKSVLECVAYPESWLSLHIYHHRSTMQALEYIYGLLTSSFLPPPDLAEQFDMELWKAFFMTLLKLVSSDALALETFPEQKRRAVWKIAGDVREQGADLLKRCWGVIGWETNSDELRRYNLSSLGGYQVQYVPSLVCPIVELCLSVHEGLRRVAVEILQTMIVSEWALNEDLGLIETEMIASLDLIFKTKNINESITQKLFIGELLDLFESIASLPDDALWIALKELVTTIDELMDLLVAAHGDSVETSLHTLRLMEFMKDMQKEDIFIRYVHQLALMQEHARNPTEAGLALQSHADLYAWDTSRALPAISSPTFPEQTSFERREALYFQMIEHYEEGKAWTLALASYQELAHHYEHTTFDFSKLARAQRSMGKINEAIATQEKPYPRYFRVHYRGLGFPSSIRDKQYIFEGTPNERMATFTDRMQKQHPTASVTQASQTDNVEGQYLQVSSVSPFRDLCHPVYQRSKVPPAIREHLLVSMPHQFSITSRRPVTGTSIREQSVEKTVFTTAEPFPNLLRRSEVLAAEEVRLTPLQTALERTWRKTADLLALEKRAISGEDPNNGALTESLAQLLDLDSPGGTCLAHYRQFFPDPNDEKKEDQEDTSSDENKQSDDTHTRPDPLLHALSVAIADHASLIRRCLTLYTRPSLQATRKDLSELFEQAYPDDVRISTPPSRSQAAQPEPRLPTSASSRHSRGSSSFDSANRLGPGLSPARPVSAIMGKLSLDTLTQLRNADPNRVGSPEPHFESGGRKLRPDRSHHRLSLNFLKNAKGSLTPEQPQELGARRGENIKPQPQLHPDIGEQSRGVFLRGGYDEGPEGDGSRAPTPRADGITKDVPLPTSWTEVAFSHFNTAAGNSTDTGASPTPPFEHADPDMLVTTPPRERSISWDRKRNSVSGDDLQRNGLRQDLIAKTHTANGTSNKRHSFIGTVIGSLTAGKASSAAGVTAEREEASELTGYMRPGSPLRTSESNEDFGKRLTDSLGANISSARFTNGSHGLDSKRPSKDHRGTAAGDGRLSTESRPGTGASGITDKSGLSTGKERKRTSLLRKWGRKKSEDLAMSASSITDGRKFRRKQGNSGIAGNVVEE